MTTSAEVPEVHYDHRDEQGRRDPWTTWKWMREHNPLLYSDQYDGFYVVPRYQDVADAARDTDAFSSALGYTTIPPLPTPKQPPIHTDPPESRYWREILNPFFTPAKISEYEVWIRELAAEIIDPLLASDSFNVPRQIGVPLTRQVILRLMGIDSAPDDINAWTDAFVYGLGEEAAEGAAKFMAFVGEQLALQKANPKPGKLITELARARFGPQRRPITDDEVFKVLLLVLGAALETTSSAISAMVSYLIEHPDEAAQLKADRSIWKSAMDEFVRWASPATCLARTARYDTEIGGCPVPQGAAVMLLFGSGNHDESEFPDPDKVILDRTPNRHLGFGMGPHRCLGSHLAKGQMSIVLERLLPELHKWRIEDPDKVTWTASVTRGMTSLPLVKR